MIAAFFYLFATVVIASAVMVITLRNPVYSVLFLILAFVNAAGLFMMMGAEFLALLLVVVYVGAVAVLFLFVVMMLDIDFAELRKGAMRYLPVGALIGIVFMCELILVAVTWPFGKNETVMNETVMALTPLSGKGETATNTYLLGMELYDKYFYFFQAAGFILLVAMIGAIVLTLRERQGIKRQSIPDQVARTPETVVEVRKVPFRQGV